MLIEITHRRQIEINHRHHLSETFLLPFFVFIFIPIRFSFRHIHAQPPPPTIRPSTISIVQSQRDSTPLKRSQSFANDSSPPPHPSTLCPLCQIPFDSTGFHRPVSDACGHTTCFQCFKATMIKATGCTLCQKEEDENSSVSIQPTNRSIFSL